MILCIKLVSWIILSFFISCLPPCFLSFTDGPSNNKINDYHTHSLFHLKLCSELMGHFICFENTTALAYESKFWPFYETLFAAEKVFLEKNNKAVIAKVACDIYTREQYRLVDKENFIDIPVIFIESSFCWGTGNILGQFYELISFGVANNIAVGRVTHSEAWKNESACSESESSKQMFRYLPVLFIPKSIVPKVNSSTSAIALSSNINNCDTIGFWCWENSNSYFSKEAELISLMTDILVKQFVVSREKNLQYKGNELKIGSTMQTMYHSIVIHFRCSDSLYYHKMGLMPFSNYRQIFLDMVSLGNSSKEGEWFKDIRQVIFFTDASTRGHARPSTNLICTRALTELVDLMRDLKEYKSLDIVVHYTSASVAFSMLRFARAVLCSASTFCYFARIGKSNTWIPAGDGDTNVIAKPTSHLATNMNLTFINVKYIRPDPNILSTQIDEFLETWRKS